MRFAQRNTNSAGKEYRCKIFALKAKGCFAARDCAWERKFDWAFQLHRTICTVLLVETLVTSEIQGEMCSSVSRLPRRVSSEPHTQQNVHTAFQLLRLQIGQVSTR